MRSPRKVAEYGLSRSPGRQAPAQALSKRIVTPLTTPRCASSAHEGTRKMLDNMAFGRSVRAAAMTLGHIAI
ncbi:MAG: hypothetical protein ABW321_28190 [Polyangiales bacterium]